MTLPHEQEVLSQLDIRLRQLDPRYVQMRYAAWTTFYSQNPDRFRQSMTTMRELFNQVLRNISPDDCFSEAEKESGRITRKMRLRKVLGKSSRELDLIDRLIGAADAIYDAQSKIVHSENLSGSEHECEFVLSITECVMKYLLDRSEAVNAFPSKKNDAYDAGRRVARSELVGKSF